MVKQVRLPEVMFFAGPNGSGKSTITKFVKTIGFYINADINVARLQSRGTMFPKIKFEAVITKRLPLFPS